MTQPLVLGIDIGGTNTSFGLVDSQGNIHSRGHLPTIGHASAEEYITALHRAALPLIQEAGHVAGIGVGAPNGNYYTGEIMFAPNLPWKGVLPLAKLLQQAFGIKATLTNDANAAAIGEMTYGVARGMKDFIMVTLGTGVGSGFVSNGQLIYGHDGFAGELGHIIAVRNGRKCGCGRNGCLETYTSATGIVRTAEEWLATKEQDSVLRHISGKITARDIHEAAVAGDAVALEIFEYTGMILGQTLADAVAITSPEAIVFFGGLARSGDILLRHVHHHMEENMLNIFCNKVKLLVSALPDADAAILGAAALAW